MTNIKVVTTMSQEYWDKVGQFSVSTWPSLMPDHWKLWFHDTPTLPVVPDVNVTETDKYDFFNYVNSKSKELRRLYKNKRPPKYQREWKMFSHKSFAMWECYRKDPTGIMIWCDADVKWTLKPVDTLLKKALDGKFCGYLGRDRVDTKKTVKKSYSKLTPETCIIVFNLDHPIADEFFKKIELTYKNLEFFNLYSWCDAAVFEHVKQTFPRKYFNDISKDYPPAIAPLPLTFLSNYFEHWMGWSNKNQKDDVSGKRERNRILQRLK